MTDHVLKSHFRESQLFTAICAGLLTLETYIAAGLNPEILVPFTVAVATLFVYNVSRCTVSTRYHLTGREISVSLNGNRQSMILAAISVPCLLLLVTGLSMYQGILLVLTGMLSLAYMMPFMWNGRRLKGFRNMIFVKNVMLALIWSLATVLMPLAQAKGLAAPGTEIWFLLARQFFFIYALTVVFDLRDIRSDADAGMQTLATRFSEKNVHHLALFSLLFFLLLIYTDPGTGPVAFYSLKTALTLSGLCSALIVVKTNSRSKPGHFAFVVDGAMLLRPFIVMAFALL